jgi:CheY-like chemotaxis protein
MPARLRILIVEDEWLIASTEQAMLQELGFDAAGPVSSVAKALEMVACQAFDAVLLDVNLAGNEKSFPVARTLLERGIPFLFVTGYVDRDFPAEFKAAPRIGKPIRSAALCRELRSLLGKTAQ